MKRFLLFMTIICLAGYLRAQNFVWAKQMTSNNMEGRSIVVDANGNVYTTGYFAGTVDFDPGASVFTMTSFGSIDIFISKLDASGNFVWAKQMGGTGGDDGLSIAVSSTGNVYTTGRISGTADFDPGPSTVNLTGSCFISKLDVSGNFVWAIATTGEGKSIALDISENIYLASVGINISTISKLDANGNFIWTKTLTAAAGMPGAPTARAIAVVNGNIHLAGDFRGTVDFNPGTGVENITASANGFILGTPDIFVLKLDNTGNYLWVKRIGSDAEDFCLSIAVDAGENVHTTGTFRETADFDPGTGTVNLTTIGLVDVFVSKLNASGNFVWAKNFGGTISVAPDPNDPNDTGIFAHATTNGNSITLDAGGNVYITGSFEGPGDPHPAGVATFGMSSFGDEDVFVVKLNSSGSVSWPKQLGGTMKDRGNCIAVNSGGDVYTTGFFRGTADFDPGPGTFNLTGGGLFISKLGSAADIDGDGYTLVQGDCDDNNAAVHPGATEVCNGIDDDCDTQTDEGVATNFYQDADGDGYGNAAVTTQACSAPSGYVTDNTDCNDANAAVHPGATEVCNGIDDDCDTQIDEGVTTTFYQDADGDGYGNAAVTTQACSVPSGYVINNTDCNDANAAVHPGATELCNGISDDCDGQIDEGVQSTFYRDFDSDGFGNAAVTIQGCSAPAGYVANNTDCNDNNAAVRPGATELCTNSIDDDCDGVINEGCTSPVTISIADITVRESAGQALIPVTLSRASTQTIIVLYVTSNGTANFLRDYRLTLGVLTFSPGQTVRNISVPIISDRIREANENFFVSLLAPVNATISDGSATITITEAASRPGINDNPITKVISNEEIKLAMPNPQRKTDQLRFYGLPPGSFTVVLTDINGKSVAYLKNYHNNWSMARLAPGMYLYQVLYKNKDGQLIRQTGKLLIAD